MKFTGDLRLKLNAMCFAAWRSSYLTQSYLTVYTDGEDCRLFESCDFYSMPVSAYNGTEKSVMSFSPMDPWGSAEYDTIMEFAFETDIKQFRIIFAQVAKDMIDEFETNDLLEETDLFDERFAYEVMHNMFYNEKMATHLMMENSEDIMEEIERAISETEDSWEDGGKEKC